MISMQGKEAVKRLTSMVMNDYGGMFGDEYNQAAKVQSDSTSVKNTDVQASLILKPIEEIAD